jgi:D-lactate dehydrogenase
VIDALKSQQLGGVALDVYEEEEGVFFEDHSATALQDDVLSRLLTFPNVLVTSHQAFLTEEALHAIAETTIDSIARYVRGEAMMEERVVV